MVDRVNTPEPGRRQMFLREGGDGLKLDETKSRCENTVQGVRLLTDSMGKRRMLIHLLMKEFM